MSDPSVRFGDLLVELGLVTEMQVQEALALQPLTGHRVGEALLSLGHVTRAQLQRALSVAIARGEAGTLDRPPLGEILIGLRYLRADDLAQALERQRVSGQKLGEVLVESGRVTHQQVYEALGLQQRMARTAELSQKEKSGEPVPAPTPNGKRVMVVDDSELACSLVQEGLTEHGYEVTTFTDPYAALEQLDLVKPDLVLTDLDMPGLDGSELCAKVKNGPRSSLPVLILTANDGESRRVSSLRGGADDYVHKGASMEELAARVETVLRRTSETERVRRLFARYTSDAVVEEVLKQGQLVLTGEKREVTVLFADIRNFTGLAESLPAEEVMALLNDVLGRLADAVLAWGGTLDKFLGDGLMAVWGAPIQGKDDPLSAASAALQMLGAVAERNRDFPNRPHIELGIGINTGEAIVGSLGNARRTEYTCIGDTVNVASRLCSLAGPGEVLLGEAIARKLSTLAEPEALAPVRMKGKALPVAHFRISEALAKAIDGQARF
jgi:adenylate cyclase